MRFPWYKYKEIEAKRVNTLQMFITNRCNLNCKGCFARNVMGDRSKDMTVKEYKRTIDAFIAKGGQKITLIGGEPLLHPKILDFIKINKNHGLKTTIYTNGYFMDKFSEEQLHDAKIRVSVYCRSGAIKSAKKMTDKLAKKVKGNKPLFDTCFMVSSTTTVTELVDTANILETNGCKVFFISSLRELDNPDKEFFDDTKLTMPVMEYKRLVHNFLEIYDGDMEIHVSKRGVFEASVGEISTRCKFANYFIGGKIIQCPYDIINLKFQKDYEFDVRPCRHNNTCLMAKVIYKRLD